MFEIGSLVETVQLDGKYWTETVAHNCELRVAMEGEVVGHEDNLIYVNWFIRKGFKQIWAMQEDEIREIEGPLEIPGYEL